ncbi:hypothetical protein JW859_02790 [bacterium]|nr:hypothetical protein [bacterium]
MHRLISMALILAALLLANACGSGSVLPADAADEQPAETSVQESAYQDDVLEVAHLVSAVPISPELMELYQWQDPPDVTKLPDLPAVTPFGRLPQETIPHERDGSDYYNKSDNATVSGTSLVLDSSAGGYAWAIYEIDDFSEYGLPAMLHLHTSGGVFAGENPGYWVGLADYGEGYWKLLTRSEAGIYHRTIYNAADFLSAASRVFYAFVLVTDGQVVTVDSFALDEEDPEWIEVLIDENTNVGWTPAIAFTTTGNLSVVYANHATGKPINKVGYRDNLLDENYWVKSVINTDPDGFAKWLDLEIDPDTGYPRVSMVYEGAAGATWGSTVGFSLIADIPGIGVSWGNYVVGNIDGATMSSIDRVPNTGYYGVTVMATNSLNTEQAAGDLQYRLFEMPAEFTGGDIPVVLKRNFLDILPTLPAGFMFKHPHLRYRPTDSLPTVCVNGGFLITNTDGDNWANIYARTDSGEFGSIDYSPATDLIGQVYSITDTEDTTLRFVEYDDVNPGVLNTVDSLALSTGTERLGSASQVAYMSDGTPGIAYTAFDGTGTSVKYAYLVSADKWQVQTVTQVPMSGVADGLVSVDLAIDDTGLVAICYNRPNGTDCDLYVALSGL